MEEEDNRLKLGLELESVKYYLEDNNCLRNLNSVKYVLKLPNLTQEITKDNSEDSEGYELFEVWIKSSELETILEILNAPIQHNGKIVGRMLAWLSESSKSLREQYIALQKRDFPTWFWNDRLIYAGGIIIYYYPNTSKQPLFLVGVERNRKRNRNRNYIPFGGNRKFGIDQSVVDMCLRELDEETLRFLNEKEMNYLKEKLKAIWRDRETETRICWKFQGRKKGGVTVSFLVDMSEVWNEKPKEEILARITANENKSTADPKTYWEEYDRLVFMEIKQYLFIDKRTVKTQLNRRIYESFQKFLENL
jgi:hypothetical protein